MKSKKLPISELLRLACIYAVKDREGFLDAIKDCKEDSDLIIETEAFIQQLKEYRLNRWGKTKLERICDEAIEVAIL